MFSEIKPATRWAPISISLIYVAVSCLWIWLSDLFLFRLFKDPSIYNSLEMGKGWFFVLASGVMIYVLIDRQMKRIQKAHETVRETQRTLSSLIGNLPGMVYRRNPDRERTISFVSEFCLELTGYRPADLIGNQTVSYNQLIHPDNRDYVSKRIQSAIDNKQPYEIIYRITTADHQEKWLWEKGRGVFSQEGALLFSEGFVTDINDQIRMEKEKDKLKEQLFQAQKMESIGRLAGGIAHDFNNLLMVIQGYGSFALKSLDPNHPARKDIQEIANAGERASFLTKQILAFCRKEAIHPIALDLNQIVQNLGKILHRLLSEDIELLVRTEPDLGLIRSDPGQIDQVIINLAVNARDAMPGGGRLIIETSSILADAEFVQNHLNIKPGPYVILTVSDTGIGMTKEIQNRIFEPFFTTKSVNKGTGLGLSTVYGIVEQSGGQILVYSELGQGTTFKMYFPCLGETLDKTALSKPIVSLLGTETILVVEDDEKILTLLQSFLKNLGYTVFAVSNGEEAIHLCEQYMETIHLLLTDMILPGINGVELAQRLCLSRPKIKTLYMSGYMHDLFLQVERAEMDDCFIEKPFLPETVGQKIRVLLDKDSTAGQEE